MTNTDQRHPGLHTHCADLEAVHASRAVAELTDAQLNEPGTLQVLPMFSWIDLGDAVGKKNTRADHEQRWLMPARIKWEKHRVIRIKQGQQVVVDYRVDAPGFSDSGQVTILAGKQGLQSGTPVFDPITEKTWTLQELPAQQSHRLADKIREAGHHAYWRRLMHFSDYAAERIDISHDRMRAEIYSTLRIWHQEWIDQDTREALVQDLVLGHGGQPSAVQRMLEAEIDREDIFDRVDPYRHAALFIKRAASEQVYNSIGDPQPRIGRLIRSVAAEHQVYDPEDLKAILTRQGGGLAGAKVETVERALHPVPNSAVKTVEVESLTGDAPRTTPWQEA